jgi:hypothetical protein
MRAIIGCVVSLWAWTFEPGSAAAQSPPSTGDVAPGVFRTPRAGTTAVQFEASGNSNDAVSVSINGTDPRSARFIPGCQSPCTLWFHPGRHLVEMGDSTLRGRALELSVEDQPLRVHFGRDSIPGIIGGVAIAGLGVLGLIIGLPNAVGGVNHREWFGLMAAGGAVVFAGGFVLTWLSLGKNEVTRIESPPDARLVAFPALRF